MLLELLLATAMILLTVVVHAVGMFLISHALRVQNVDTDFEYHPLSLKGFGLTLTMVLSLFVIHGLEIWLYAMLFLATGAVEGMRTAVYFSTISYAAIGYSDADINPRWALLAAIEGINGLLLLGWSTAFFVTIMQRFKR